MHNFSGERYIILYESIMKVKCRSMHPIVLIYCFEILMVITITKFPENKGTYQ